MDQKTRYRYQGIAWSYFLILLGTMFIVMSRTAFTSPQFTFNKAGEVDAALQNLGITLVSAGALGRLGPGAAGKILPNSWRLVAIGQALLAPTPPPQIADASSPTDSDETETDSQKDS